MGPEWVLAFVLAAVVFAFLAVRGEWESPFFKYFFLFLALLCLLQAFVVVALTIGLGSGTVETSFNYSNVTSAVNFSCNG